MGFIWQEKKHLHILIFVKVKWFNICPMYSLNISLWLESDAFDVHFLLDQTRVSAIWRIWQRKQSAGTSPKCIFQQWHVPVRTTTASCKVKRGEWKMVKGLSSIKFSIVVYAQLILLTDLCEQEVCLEIGLYLPMET